jgi:intracellular multiplication protein IcmE
VKNVGCTAQELKDSVFSVQELMDAGLRGARE